jgi:hypothetical protein
LSEKFHELATNGARRSEPSLSETPESWHKTLGDEPFIQSDEPFAQGQAGRVRGAAEPKPSRRVGGAMPHLVLLGDSIFDNAAYVRGGPDVVRQLRAALPEGWQASLAAVDGATAREVPSQLACLPGDATHLVVSAGGNDALGASGLLYTGVDHVADALRLLSGAADAFEASYAAMLGRILELGLSTALCTVYDTPPSGPDHRIVKAALALFNDRITRAAFAHSLPLVDLRLICSEDADYANPIEPSGRGGEKISRAIARLAAGPQEDWRRPLAIAA